MTSQADQSAQDSVVNASATTPLLDADSGSSKQPVERPVIITAVESSATAAPASPGTAATAPEAAGPASPGSKQERPLSQAVANEYRFIHFRIPPREGKLKFVLPILLLSFQLIFIVLFALFGNYAKTDTHNSKYPSTCLFFDSSVIFFPFHTFKY